MNVYFAPLEGITDVIFRRIHHAMFPGLAKYFIPFISPTKHLTFSSREQKAISPAENAGVPAVPQILTKDSGHFLHMSRLLADAGFREINLNLGCPSGTVTAKGKGSGMLRELDALRRMLDDICAYSPIPVSIKTRIGYESPDEWPAILAIYRDYPLLEAIVHLRTKTQMYRGAPHREQFGLALAALDAPCVYNGDLFSANACREIEAEYPAAAGLMLGRGLIANPAMAREYAGGPALTWEELRAFHDRLYGEYTACWPQTAVLGHMHEIMQHISCCFVDPTKPRKAIRKAKSLGDYLDAVNWLFDDFPMCDNPQYTVEKQ